MPDAVFPVQLEQRTVAWTMSIQRDARRAPAVAKGLRKNAMAALALGQAMTCFTGQSDRLTRSQRLGIVAPEPHQRSQGII